METKQPHSRFFKAESLTIQELYQYAFKHHLVDARIRICDGMAVSYYPTPECLYHGRYEVVIDVSALQPVEYDDLDTWAQRIVQ